MNFYKAIRQTAYILFFSIISVHSIFAQSNFKSEAELKKKADELFLEGEYVQAYPLYSQLLSLYPKDHFYNFRFGACIIYADKDKEKAIKYLEYAVSKTDIDIEAYFFLGKAYHINYRFDDAIKAYSTFKSKAGNKKRKLLNPEREIEMCENGKKLLSNITDIIVVEKKEVPRTDFFRSYETSKFGGKILAKPDELKSSYDKKVKENSVIFVPNTTGGEIYFSSYGDNDKNGKDIYKVKRLPNGEFSAPQNVGFPINTPYDEEYPVLHPNGRILYFCSKGHNSMGGYDVFKSTFDVATQTWSTPVNLDFAINTPDDDILFIADENNEEAYFSSTRASIGSNIGVYKILMLRKPVDLVTIKGNFKHFNENYDKEVKISVRTIQDNVEIASVKTDEETGDYLLNIPHGAKYKFIIEGEGFATQSGIVDVPSLENPRPLKQEMELVNINGEARLMIKNLFDEELPGLAFTPPLEVIRKKARLDVNYNEAEAKRLKEKQAAIQPTATADSKTGNNTAQADKTAVKTNEPASSISNQQLIEMAKSDVEDLKKEAAALREEADFAYAFAKLKSEESRNTSSPLSEQYAKEAVLAYNLAIELDNQASAKEREAQKAEKYAADIEKAIKSNSNKEALAILEKQRQELANDKKEERGAEGALAAMRDKAAKKRAEAERYETKANESREDAEAIQIEIKAKETEMAKTKDSALKEKLKEDIKDLNIEYEAVKKQSENFAARSIELKNEAANIEYDIELLTKLIDTYKNEADDAAYADLSNEEKAGLKNDISSLQIKAKQAEEQNLAANNNKSGINKNNVQTVNNTSEKSLETSDKQSVQNIPFKHGHLTENGNIADYNTAYLDDLDRVATIENEFEKNASIATIYNNWANTIQAEISYRTENLSKLNKKERKTEEQKIASLEKQRDEKRQLSAEAQAKVQQLFAANTSNKNQPKNDSNSSINQSLNTNNSANTSIEADEEEEDTEEEVVIKSAVANQSNLQTQTKATAPLSTSNTVNSNNQSLAQSSGLQVQSKNTDEDNEDELETNQNKSAQTLTSENISNTSEQANISLPNSSNNVFASQEYAFPAAQAENKRSQGHALEAELLSRRAQKLRDEAAAMSNEEDRKAAFKEADELDKKADAKREEAALATAKANQAEYLNLESVISNTALKIKDKNAPEVDMASLLREEAQYYFNEAKLMRENGLKATNTTSRLNALERANIIEKDAIEKQQRSLELYAKAANLSVNDALALSGAGITASTTAKSTTNNTVTTAASTSNNVAQTNIQAKATSNQLSASNTSSTAKSETVSNQTFATTINQEQIKKNERIAQLEKQMEEEQKRLEILEEEAEELEKEAADLKKKADETKKKKDKITAQEVYKTKNEEAIAKRNEVLKANENIERLQDELNELKSQESSSPAVALNNQNVKNFNNNSPINTNNEVDEDEDEDMYNDVSPKNSNNKSVVSTSGVATTAQPSNAINTNKQLSPSEAARIGASPEWNQYYTYIRNSEAAQKRADAEKQEAVQLRKDAFELSQKADELNEKAEDIDDEDEKEEVLANAKQIQEQANNKLAQADAKEKSAKENENLAVALQKQAENYLLSQNKSTQENLIAYQNMQKASGFVPNQPTVDNTANNQSASINTSLSNNTVSPGATNIASNLTVRNNASLNNTSNSSSAINFNSTPKRYEIPKQLNEEIFDRTNTAVYSDANPIPVDVELPEGLIFKVQVGAFRNRIPQDLFKGFAPVTGETTPSGLIRYTAGFFKAFETADLAKEVIKGYGYEDAFVVAFYNGKRITISEARQIQKNQGISSTSTANVQSVKSQNNVQTSNITNQNAALNNQNLSVVNQQKNNNLTNEEPPLIAEPGTAAYRMVEQMQGLLYTVQCGVYSRPVPPSQLFNIQPLLVEKTSNGMLRYTSGVYNDINLAIQAKNKIVDYGIKDAFVTAYYNGKRISVAEAKAIEAANGSAVFVKSSDMNKMPYQSSNAVINENRNIASNNVTVSQPNNFNQSSNTTQSNYLNTSKQPVTVQGLGTTNNITNVDKSKPVYKVQIGAFKEEVPIEIAVIYMKLAPKGISYRLREDGFTVYTVGATNSIDEANRLKQEVINEGITDAFLVAFENDKQVPIIATINNNNSEIKVINPVNDEENEDDEDE